MDGQELPEIILQIPENNPNNILRRPVGLRPRNLHAPPNPVVRAPRIARPAHHPWPPRVLKKDTPETMKVFVKYSKTFTLTLRISSTMLDLKNEFEELEGTPVQHQFYVCLNRNRLLEAHYGDQRTKLTDMGVQNGSTLQMVIYDGPSFR